MENNFAKNLNRRGQLNKAQKIIRLTLARLKNSLPAAHLELCLGQALSNAQPRVVFRNKKVAGVVHKIPTPYETVDRYSLAARWLVRHAREKIGSSAASERLAQELIDSYQKRGATQKKKKDLQRLALANRSNLKYM